MLWFVGLGISGLGSISLDAQNILKKADIVYLEQFTSIIPKSDITKLKKLVKGEFKAVKRWMVEDGQEILKNAKKKNVVLLSYGDPYIATTHIELRTRAIQEKIKTNTIHASSALTALVGECGLHYYKIGKVVTIMKEIQSTSAYYAIYGNLLSGDHTILLLEYNQDAGFFLDPKDALSNLLSAEKEQVRNVLSQNIFAIVTSRIGLQDQMITGGKISNLIKLDFGKPPHTIIIPGSLHFTESDALKVLAKCVDKPTDNSAQIKKIADQMMEKYIPMVRKALEEITPHYKDSKEFRLVLENAGLYIEDAKKFHEQGKDELAVLSIGYADGLVDALRMAKGFEPKI
ncbi:MAG: diphthine synthase [Nitrosopumilales archaeon]|nr:diphthine synthase [Nitrosopumilales archaeon]